MARIFAGALACAWMLFLPTTAARAQAGGPQDMTVASFGGAIDQAMKEIFRPFEQENNVTIRWIPATGAENVSKVAATKAAPEFDVAFLDNLSFSLGAKQGLFAKLDLAQVPNAADLHPEAKPASNDGAAFGFYYSGIFYRPDEFAKRGWAPPRSWKDFARPEFCRHIGIMHPNTSFGLTSILMFGQGDLGRLDDVVKTMTALRTCIPVLEPSAPKLEEKIQLGEYLIGANGTVRVIPLMRKGVALAFVLPQEGAVLGSGMVAPVLNARRPELAQKFINWILSPAAQARILEDIAYSPANRKVAVTAEQKKLGLLDNDQIKKMIIINDEALVDQKRNIVRQVERAMSP